MILFLFEPESIYEDSRILRKLLRAPMSITDSEGLFMLADEVEESNLIEQRWYNKLRVS